MTGARYAGAAVAEQAPLAPLTTLRTGPVAKRLITVTSTEQIVTAVTELDAEGADPLLLAGGSNVVIADDVADLTVLRLASAGITVTGNLVRAEAGARWDDVVTAALDAGLGGLECLSGIPGSAGATPVQNVGAYGVEVADVITRVRLLNRRTGEVSWAPAERLRFGYRTSVLKGSDGAVALEVEFALDDAGRSAPLRYGELSASLGVQPGQRADPRRVREAVLALRRGKGMVLDADDHDTWSVGSFFTNPVVPRAAYEAVCVAAPGPVPNYPVSGDQDQVKLAAGWLVERAGFGKGYPDVAAPARLSTKHALALTNRGSASTSDILALARAVRDGVAEKFGITLVPEPVLIGARL